MSDITHMTPRQLEALQCALDKGGAAYLRGRRMGGAKFRMIDRLAADGLLSDIPPFPITDKGKAELQKHSKPKG